MTFPFIPIPFPEEGCATGDIDSAQCAKQQSGICNTPPTPGCSQEIEINVYWDYTTCEDDCHHIEVWRKIRSGTSCTGGTYTKQVDDKGCTSQTSCSKGAHDGCWRDYNINYGEQIAGFSYRFCYRVDIRQDSGDGQDDYAECSHQELDAVPCSQCGVE